MRATHYQKRSAISKKDLIVGIDIGSRFHAVVIQDKEGQIIKSYEKIYNSRKGLDKLMREAGKEKKYIVFEAGNQLRWLARYFMKRKDADM